MVKFYCENCRFEVPLDVKSCPYCGKAFYSVYCPRCRTEGSPAEFKNGCPRCGYMAQSIKSSRVKSPLRRGAPTPIPKGAYFAAAVLLVAGIITLLILLLFKGGLQ